MSKPLVKMVQGDLEPDVAIQVLTRDKSLCPSVFARDISELTVRALFYKKFEVTTGACDQRSLQRPSNAIWYRELTKRIVLLIESTATSGSEQVHAPTSQPESQQKISIIISNLTVDGDITLTGTDRDGVAVTETIDVTNAALGGTFGELLSTKSFASIDQIDATEGTAGIETNGDFSFSLHVHDGIADFIWQPGDTDEAGDFLLAVELIHASGEKETACDPIAIKIKEKIQIPIPEVSDIQPSPFNPGSTVQITGINLFEVSSVQAVNMSTGDIVALNSIAVQSDVLVEADLPSDIKGGEYLVHVTSPGGTNIFHTIFVLPYVTTFTPISLIEGETVIIQGNGFLGATGIEIVNLSDSSVISLDNLNIVNVNQIEGNIPVGTPEGSYVVRVIQVSNRSTEVGILTVT